MSIFDFLKKNVGNIVFFDAEPEKNGLKVLEILVYFDNAQGLIEKHNDSSIIFDHKIIEGRCKTRELIFSF